jgi:hypothetical protein
MPDSKSKIFTEIISSINSKACNVIKYTFYKDDGSVFVSTMGADNTEKMGKLVKFYSREMQINNYFVQEGGVYHLILYRVATSVFLLVITDTDVDETTRTLLDVFMKFGARLDKIYHDAPVSFDMITRYVIISQGLEMGPEPVAIFPPDIPQDVRMKIALKSMLLLTAEREGAIRGIPATIPFIEFHAMGVIFLFDVPDENARGGAYDSCISILVDESYRPAIYENMFELETVCIEGSEMIRGGESYQDVITFIFERLSSIELIKTRTVEIEGLMKDQLKRIQKELGPAIGRK